MKVIKQLFSLSLSPSLCVSLFLSLYLFISFSLSLHLSATYKQNLTVANVYFDAVTSTWRTFGYIPPEHELIRPFCDEEGGGLFVNEDNDFEFSNRPECLAGIAALRVRERLGANDSLRNAFDLAKSTLPGDVIKAWADFSRRDIVSLMLNIIELRRKIDESKEKERIWDELQQRSDGIDREGEVVEMLLRLGDIDKATAGVWYASIIERLEAILVRMRCLYTV